MSAKVSFLHFRFSNGLYFFLCDSEYCGGDEWIVEPVISFLNGLLNIAVLVLITCAKKHDW